MTFAESEKSHAYFAFIWWDQFILITKTTYFPYALNIYVFSHAEHFSHSAANSVGYNEGECNIYFMRPKAWKHI